MCQVFEPAHRLQLQSLQGISGFTEHAQLCHDWLRCELLQALGLLLFLLYSGWKMSYFYIINDLINTDSAGELKVLPPLSSGCSA